MDMYEEAKQLLEQTQLEGLLNSFGEIELVGSYRYRTMVERDIDFQLWPNNKIDFTLRSQLLEELGVLVNCRSISMSDLLHFPDFANKPLKGIWYGLSFIHPSTEEKWSVDIWLIDKKDDPTQAANSLHQQMLDITEEQRREIVYQKQQTVANGDAIKGKTSAEIYRSIITA
jgi:hypothetical protein